MKMEDREQGRDVGTHRPPTSSVPAIWPYSAGSSTTALPLCPLGFKVGPDSVDGRPWMMHHWVPSLNQPLSKQCLH